MDQRTVVFRAAAREIRVTLSVVVITLNEAAQITRCLESVAWADECIVLDSGSDDGTVDLARSLGAKVHRSEDWPGFGRQKNRALLHACGDWILSLDADECVTPELGREIQAVIATPDACAAYRMPRLSSYCGREMHHSGWWPDRVTRLFRRGSAHFSNDLVHEKLEVAGATGTLQSALHHEAFRNLDEVLEKVNRYSSAGAQMLNRSGRHASLTSAILHGSWAFFRTYFLRAGLLDGREGFMLAVSNAEGTYYRYLKLLELQTGK